MSASFFTPSEFHLSGVCMFKFVVTLFRWLVVYLLLSTNSIVIQLMVFRCGWSVISQETDFYFNKTAAQCWKGVTHFKSPDPQVYQKKTCILYVNLLIESSDTLICNREVVKQKKLQTSFEDTQRNYLICLKNIGIKLCLIFMTLYYTILWGCWPVIVKIILTKACFLNVNIFLLFKKCLYIF